MTSVQGYIEINNKKMTDEEYEEFQQFLSKYFLNYKELSVIEGREYDSVILKDINLLNDKQDEEGNIVPGILTIMKDRNVVINGMWNQNGIPYGQKRVTEQIGEETISKLFGEPLYPFSLDMHLKHTPDDIITDEEGNIISKTKINYFKPLHKFSGWGTIIEY